MIAFILTYLGGEARIRSAFGAMGLLLTLWLGLAVIALQLIGAYLAIPQLVGLINGLVFLGGALAIYLASITGHSISQSYLSRLQKWPLRFFNFLTLFSGIVMIILVTSGEVSWMVYLFYGVTSGLR